MNKAPVLYLLMTLLCLPSALLAAEYPAHLRWADVRIVSVPIEAVVARVAVRAGQLVQRGEMLLQLQAEPLRHGLRSAQARVEAIEPELEDALREKNDAEALYEQMVLSEVELRNAQIRHRQVAARLAQARAERDLARWRVAWAQLEADDEALVIERRVQPGQVIAGDLRGAPLLRLASASAMLAEADIPAKVAAALALGDAVAVMVDGKRHDARVSEIQLQADNQGLVRLSVRLAKTGGMVAGLPARLLLP